MNQSLQLDAIDSELIDERTKGFPYGTPPIPLNQKDAQCRQQP